MSYQAVKWAAQKILIPDGTLKCVLLVMADVASKDGRDVWLSQATLAERTGFTDRTIRRTLDKLQELELIRPGNPTVVAHLHESERPLVWDLNIKRVIAKDEVPRKPRKLQKATATPPDFKSTTPGHKVHDPRTLSPTPPDTESETPGHKVLQIVLEPSIEPSIEEREPYVSNASRRNALAPQAADPVDAVCARFRQQRAAKGFTRGLDVTSTDRHAARSLLRDGYAPDVIAQMAEWALNHERHWRSRIKDLASLAGNAEKIHHEMESDQLGLATVTQLPKKDRDAGNWAQGFSDPAAAMNLLGFQSGLTSPALTGGLAAIEERNPDSDQVIELAPADWKEVA